MITIYHANQYSDNEKGYTKVATVNVDNISDAFRLTNNIGGSWSKPATFTWDGVEEVNEQYDDRVEVLVELETDDAGNAWGLRSTSSGDVLFDGEDYWFLVPLHCGRDGKFYDNTHGKTVKIANFDISGFEYDDRLSNSEYIEKAQKMWYDNWVKLGSKDQGTCVLGAHIDSSVGRINPPPVQGNVSKYESAKVVMDYLDDQGISWRYDDGIMD